MWCRERVSQHITATNPKALGHMSLDSGEYQERRDD